MTKSILLRGVEVAFGADLTGFEKGLEQVQRSLRKFGSQTKRFSKDISEAFNPLAIVGTGAALAANEYDKAFAAIQRGTGKTGKALESLQKSFTKVFSENSETATEVSTIIAKLNKGLGVVGKPLEQITTQIVDLSDVAGTNLTSDVDQMITMFNGWRIATEDQATALDVLYKASLETGSSVAGLISTLGSSRMILQELGYSFGESAAFVASFSKAGIDATQVLAAIKKGFQQTLKEGGNPAERFAEIAKAAKDGAAGTEVFAKAIDFAGSKSGPVLAKSLIDNAKNFDVLISKLKESPGLVEKITTETETIGEKLANMRNLLTAALAPLGKSLVTAVEPAFKTIILSLKAVSDWVTTLDPRIVKFAASFAGLAVVLAPTLRLLAAIPALLAAILTPLGALTLLLGVTTAAVLTFGDQIAKTFDRELGYLKQGASEVGKTVEVIWKDMKSRISGGGGLFDIGDIKDGNQSKLKEYMKAANTQAEKELLGTVKEVTVAQEAHEKITSKVGEAYEQAKKDTDALFQNMTGGVNVVDTLAEALEHGLVTGTNEATKAMYDLQKQIESFKQDQLAKDLNTQIDQAIKSGDSASFGALKAQLVDATESGVLTGLDEAVRGTPAAKEYAKLQGDALASEIDTRYKEAMVAAHEESVRAWQSFFENAITGVKFDFEDMLKQVAVGFAAEIAASVTKGIDLGLDFSSPQGFGSSLAKNIFGGISDSVGAPGGILEGLKMSALGLEGPMTEAQTATVGFTSSLGIAAAAIGGAALTFKGIRDALKGKEDNSALGLSSRAQAGFTTGGFSEIARLFAGGGKKDPDANAREQFADELGKLIREIKGITIQGSDGPVKLSGIDVFGGRDKFDPGNGGFDFLQSLSGEAQTVFTGLGTAFKEIFKLEGSDGAQLGAILSENLLGDIDNARLLVQQLGLDFETLKEGVLKTALDGSVSWLEFNSTVAGLSSAFEPGLAAVGAVGEALEDLKNSSGRGFQAVKSVRDLAQEAIEAGAKSMEDFRQKLLANGASAEEAQQILEAATGRGITSLEGLAGASDELAGSIAGDLEAMGFGYKKLSEDVLSVKNALDQINQVELKAKDLVVNVKVNDPKGAIDGQIESTAVGGSTTESPVARSYTHGGVTGSVSVRQARMRSIGVNNAAGAGTTYNIDARGADVGVERRIIAALQSVEERAVRRSVTAMVDGRNRGRY